MGEGEGEAKKKGDPRVEWVLKRLSTLMGVRAEKLDKFQAAFSQDAGSMQALNRFLDEPECTFCGFYPTSESVSANSTDLPSGNQMKKKFCMMHRSRPEVEIGKDNIGDSVIIVEVTKNVMDLLNVYCHSVYLSTLMNPANQRGWSDLIAKDLMDKYHVFLANLYVTVGLMKGHTMLPQPPRDALPTSGPASGPAAGANSGMGSKDRVHVLEGAVITWTKQIRHVLKQDPEMLLKEPERNPEPLAELDFWKNKAANLNSIHSQLGNDALKKVLKFLETNKSTYTTPFSRLQKEVEEAREEANDNVRFLTTLRKGIDKLMSESADFEALDKLFDSVLHNILLIWRYSKYYTTPTRLAVLIREICNTVISQATRYIDGPAVFSMISSEEASECYDKLDRTLQICTAFKDTYVLYRDIAAAQGGDGWKMKNDALFVRLDAFRERCRDALDFTRTVMQFTKLERIEIGGTKGKTLSDCVVAIHEEFNQAVETFKAVPYDIMNVGERQFDHDFYKFRVSVKELDRRLGSLLGSAFDDLDTVQGRLKLFDNFEGLLERPIIQAELERKHKALLRQYQQDLAEVETNFIENREKVDECYDDAPIFLNLPPVAGAIYWARSSRTRISEPMTKLVLYNHTLRETPEEFREVEKQYSNLNRMLEGYEKHRYSSWEETSVDVAKEKLKMRLLRRQEKTGLLKVNFDPALVRLLREVRFFLIFDIEVPEAAQEMFNQASVYRQWNGQLDHIVQMYNSVLTELLPVEEPLLEDRITKMDMTLSPGLTDLKWRSEDKIPEFIETSMKVVSDVSSVVEILKQNLRNISKILSSWCKEPIIERKRGAKPMAMEAFDQQHKERVGVRMMAMSDGGKEIHKFLKDSSEALKVSKVATTWKSYVDFVNNIVIEGFVASIAVSLQNLCEILDPLFIERRGELPLFDVKIELQSEIVFDPPFRPKDSEPSLRKTIDDWLKDFFGTVTCMARLDVSAGDYLNEIREHFQMQSLLSLVSDNIDNTEEKCMEYRESFMQHSFLWMESIDKSFEKFLNEGAHDLVEGFEEEGMSFRSIMERIKVDIGRPIPKLAEFDKKIEFFAKMKRDLSNIKTPEDIHWLRINAGPVRIALVQYATQWEQKYTAFLKEFTESRIKSLVDFIDKLKHGLGSNSPVDEPNNEKLLYATMTHIADVKLAKTAVNNLFQPIRELCVLLKKHHVTHVGLQELEQAPSKWDEVIRLAYDEKEKILPLQNEESIKIRNKIDAFGDEVQAFRKKFQFECPFDEANAVSGEYDTSYQTINEYYGKTLEISERAGEYNDLELLFDMQMSNYRDLKECVEELVLLKNLWDGVILVMETFANWNDILWEKIDTDALVQTVRDFQTQVKNMPKGVRTWKLYKWLMDEVKNMATVLPLINDLHSETMADRHWTSLMTVTSTSFDKGPDFCFKNLLDLQLHHFADDVSEIVDQSVKEAKIEKKLLRISKDWAKMPVTFDVANPECPLLGELGEVLERLDGDSLEMMGMTSQGRFIEFCKPLVDEWSGKLRTIDSTLNVWQKVQANWCRLEPIFMQSDDIRSQLPEDAKRFEQMDNGWKDLMLDASQNYLIVDICCAEGREEALNQISEGIDTCEKSLNEYLEQKKKVFPRFYFVANQALLDILSNGNRPLKVAEYLGDMFDGVKTLNFSKAADTGKIASGIFAKDGEKVPFVEDITLEGAVENYLVNLEAHFRLQLREILEQARASADNWEMENFKPREFWLEDYCAQLALVGTQIMWTEETSRTFEEIESGSENAMKEYKKVNDERIEKLIKRVQTPLSREVRNKIITIITIDVHGRDVIEDFVVKKITDSTDFKWLQQLRFSWNYAPQGMNLVSYTPDEIKTCVIKICDWTTIYCYEYVGNCGRLVITPLTDRCYITLTQALNLTLGGAPAGPAGTGKTETTKDLSRAIGLQIVVFNCSDQMTYQTMAQIFMGIAQTGCWGCFDEFNRISIEVLSVVSTQYKTILDGIRQQVSMLNFMDEEIRLINTNGAFITMNPGYAGRTELPENLKALFRSVAMIVPDLRFICENMLMSEGFIKARPLANKFVQLYALCKELLSKQMHYDWGLRAVKSLLRQAGGLKRAEPESDENPVLCRALRDFNTPKITTGDMPIFLRLIQDLFPGIWPNQFENPEFEKVCIKVAKERGLQPDTQFIIKTVGMLGILEVRHCMFIIGPTGCGKTEVWKTLMESLKATGKDGMWEQANPKGVTSDELYGTMSKTKEWKDGLIAVIMRNMSKEINGYKSSHQNKWVILDGDIDATWIESMNTVMDDNKVLTLVSNERIPFTPSMRMILEIQDMKHASPATVSRGGVLFINETDIGWKPYMESWRERMDPVPQNTFYLLFTNYFESQIEAIRKQFGFSCPIYDMGFVQSITCFVDALMESNTKDNLEALRTMPVEDLKNAYDAIFAFAVMWAIGGCVADDKTVNYRKAWNGFMKGLSKVKFPDQGECYDFFFEPRVKEWVSWEEKVIEYNPIADRMFQNIVISNMELERLKYVLDLHIKRKKPVLYVGVAGTGKTTIVKDYLADLKARTEDFMSVAINNNNYTTSLRLQSIIMGSLDKRTGRTFGPPSNKKCIFFIDDLNMPYVDTYDTQSAIMLLTQMLAYAEVYDRDHLEEKKNLVDILFTACMNPKAGSFMVNPRLQRRFTVMTTFMPTAQLITSIYSAILSKHCASFVPTVQKLVDPVVISTIETLTAILNTPCFLPSASKFHYQFNLKDVANIFQGLLLTNPALYKDGAVKFARVWLHECYRVFSDRLVCKEDQAELNGILEKVATKQFGGMSKEDLFAMPLIMTSFVSQAGGNDRQYLPAKDAAHLKKVVEDKLVEYNETYAAMNLVLFEDALGHVCRISRITDNPCGNALLVGVGGSGKQSLARLGSFINMQEVLTILVNQSYGLNELKIDLQEFYKKAAVKPGLPHAFLMTDGQIADERFLVDINDMLSSGNIPDLFTREEYDGIFGGIRNAAKASGYADDRDGLFAFFIDKVRKNLHLVLCHSPVGDTFRIRGRKFPALISCMVVDEFMPWPRDALDGVARRFLVELQNAGNITDETLLGQVAANMAEVHISIDAANKNFLITERRHNYTTPKSFLELIVFYIKMLTDKQSGVTFNCDRLERGLAIMEQVQEKVEGLKEDLKITMVQVEEKKAATAVLIEQVTKASAHAAEEKAKANEEEAKTTVLAEDAAKLQAEADGELKEAMPAMEAAKEAVNCLDKNSIGELKGFGKPPPECIDVTAACAYLLKNEKKKIDWKAAQKMMANPNAFIDEVKAFNANEIPEQTLKNTDDIIALPFFNFETMKSKSIAAANLANWVINCVKYHKIYVKVAPLMAKVEEATQTKETAEASLAIVKKQVADIEAECAALDEKLSGAVAEKERVEQQAAKCLEKLQLAERLVNGLADEYKRWTDTVKDLKELTVKLIGNCLLSSAFVGYISPFNMRLRLELWKEAWIKDIQDKQIPISEGIDPLKVLASEADQAGWQNEGLPSDRISLENAAVVTSCSRWPLMIDPQLQGVKWIKQRIGEELTVLQFTMNNWLQKVIFAIQMGGQLLLESVGSEIDAILEPVLSRAVVKRGRTAMIIKIGGEEVDYDPKFQLYLQSKLPNPHYRPEIAAQCTIINFIVTPEGLEDQILAMVVNVEKPELEQQKQALVRRQNEFKVTLAGLEDDLLSQLSNADPATILDNLPLIEGLEKTKQTSKEIGIQVAEAQKTEVEINASREAYRPVAAEGSMLFFLIIQLCFIEHMYQYSLDSFVSFLYKAIEKTEACEDVYQRTLKLIAMIRIVIFRWVNRGLFEEHKLIFCSMLTFKLFMKGALHGEEFNASYFNFLLRAPGLIGMENPLAEWLPSKNWGLALKLSDLEGFDNFSTNMEKDAPNRFKEWFNELAPEDIKLPLDWKRLDSVPFQKLLVLRCLRPDRLTGAMADWIRNILPDGREYMDCDGSSSFQQILVNSFEDSTSTTPIFFILSPGADPVKEVEAMGRKMINLQLGVNYHNVAMGQGQDVVAMAKLEISHREGHWVMLQNIHLMPKWCIELEKKLDAFAVENSHPNMRVILSADPNKGIPIGILERSIKLTNEPPQGMLANLRRSFALFSKEDFEDKDGRVKSILFALVHFHSLMLERKKFGAMGYNMKYPFSAGDLRDSAQVLYNYLEGTSAVKIPWDDLRYIFGEIMYGGHIVDDWDRRMCEKYLLYFMRDELLDEIEMIPYADGKLSWVSPQAGPHEKYIEHIESMPTESPLFFGMHPNAEINFRTTQCDKTFDLLMTLMGAGVGASGDDEAVASPMAIAEALCGEILEEVQEKKFATEDISRSLSDEEKGPYQFVFLQECDYMNGLIFEMVRGLQELKLGFAGELTMSEQMEDIADSLWKEKLPTWWVKLGFASTRPLKSWRVNLQERCVQLEDWTNDPLTIPKVVDIAKLFNPQSFLTAIKQLCCQQQGLELDKLQVFTEVTKREAKQVEGHSKEGAFVTGMFLEGARWDSIASSLEDSKPKEMFVQLPVINCKAGPLLDKVDKNVYICPAYCVPTRRPYFVFPAQLRTKAAPDKWVLAGVAIILDIGTV